jgi:preprotein translocase SecE subunit
MAIFNRIEQSQLFKKIKSQERSEKVNENNDYSTSKNFFVSTYQELRKVIWPSFGHVIRWSVITLIFCAIIGLLLGYTDRFFSSSIIYTDCVVKVQKGQTSDKVSDCTNNYLQTLVLRK